MHAHLTSLVDTHKYAMQQNRALGELIEEGVENQVAVVAAIAERASAEVASFSKDMSVSCFNVYR